jgi:hypothetical protein
VKWLKRSAVAAGVVLLLWALAWAAVPPLLKWQLQTRGTELLGRPVTVAAVDFRPWSLNLTLHDLAIGGAAAGAGTPLLQVAQLRVNVSASSLFRLAPVIERLDIEAPKIQLARLSEGHYDIDDLLEKFGQAPAADKPAAAPAKFALYNLTLRDGQVRFDDRPMQRVHVADAIHLALPFISDLSADVAVHVEPHLSFHLNGAPFDSGVQATPFAQTRQAELKLSLADLDVAPYVAYLPSSLPVRLTRGRVSADLGLQFAQPAAAAPRVSLRGTLQVSDLAVAEPSGAPLLEWKHMRLGLADVQPLLRQFAFDSLRIDGAQVHLARDAQGQINVLRLAAANVDAAAAAGKPHAPSAASAANNGATAAAKEPSLRASCASIELADARIAWDDAAVAPKAALQLAPLSIKTGRMAWPMVDAMPLELKATLQQQTGSGAQGTLVAQGVASPRDATLDITLSDLALETLAPYLAQLLTPRVEGHLSAHAKVDWSANADAPRLRVDLDQAALESLRMRPSRASADRDGVSLARLSLAGVQVDLAGRRATIGEGKLAQPFVMLARDGQGSWNVVRWLQPALGRAEASGAPPAQAKPSVPADKAQPWQVEVHAFSLEGGRLRLEDDYAAKDFDDNGEQGAGAELQQLNLGVQNLVWHGDRPAPAARVQLSGRVGELTRPGDKAKPVGAFDWKGDVGLRPKVINGNVRVTRFPVHLFAGYFAHLLPVRVLGAEAGYTGRVALRERPAGLDISATGDALLGGVHVGTLGGAAVAVRGSTPRSRTDEGLDASELLGWQSLALKHLEFTMRPRDRPRLEIAEVALTDFYSRLVVTEEGHFNLQDVGPAKPAASAASAPGNLASAAEPASAVEAAPAASATPAAEPASAAASAPAAADAGLPIDLIIGGTKLENGHVDFTDHFVRPNYSAALTELQGEIGAFRSDRREMATLKLHGRAAGSALLDISGQLNPLVRPPAMDIQAKAVGLELAPLSPYAGKYAGYAIERGQLSLDVSYKIDPDGKLEAKNQLILNQLTFGERIESPSATKLPVRLAVALLTDRNGVIDINLPISGSLNDPQFSVGGIIVKVLLNLLVKIVTAPFAWLAGGGGQDLSVVEFKPGSAVIADAGASAIDKVAKALTERPALKMTVVGTADPAIEGEAYRRAALESKLQVERRREALREAEAAASAPAPMSAAERSRTLKALYRQTDLPDKPRNMLGFAKDIADAEMEALLKKHVVADDEALRQLALQRGLTVRDALIAKGLPSDRLLLAAPKLHVPEAGEAAWTPSAKLSLSVK